MKKEEHILFLTTLMCIVTGLISGGLAAKGYLVLPLIMTALIWLISHYIIYILHNKQKRMEVRKCQRK